ncbi:MAG: fibrobacter succinogenes major paralogous domain-containing protein [Bacteroidota bacterium]
MKHVFIYSWNSAMNGSTDAQGICLTGWHIPTDTELQTLIDYLGGDVVAGGKMKETGTVHWNSPNTGADNSSGFSALPAGYYDPYSNLGLAGYFWSSTSADGSTAYSRNLFYYDRQDVVRGSSFKGDAVSVRCIKD